MTAPIAAELVRAAQAAGYRFFAIEHPRSRRWLLTLHDRAGATVLVLVQSRPLISATDVQELAEMVQVRRVSRGILWAYDGDFSAAARLTCAELRSIKLVLCTRLPVAS
jgi:hypothetical protein